MPVPWLLVGRWSGVSSGTRMDTAGIMANELKCARISLGWSVADMARQLETPTRTYWDWEAGNSRVPGVALVACRLLLVKDTWDMNQTVAKILAQVDRRYPNGIPSAVVPDGEE